VLAWKILMSVSVYVHARVVIVPLQLCELQRHAHQGQGVKIR